MAVFFPNRETRRLRQINQTTVFGDIVESFNLDLTSDLGKIQTRKTVASKKQDYTNDVFAFGQSGLNVGVIETYNGLIHLISGQSIFTGGNSPSDPIALMSGSPAASIQNSDLANFNNNLWVANQNSIQRYDGSWTSVHTFATSGQEHLLEQHFDKLLFTFDRYKVGSISTSNVVSTTGTGTIDFALPGFSISFLASSGDRVWVGLINTGGGASDDTYIYEWDGQSENISTRRHTINARGVLAGCIMNNTPYIVDTNGRLLGFNGSFFEEVARFPMTDGASLGNVGNSFTRSVHPNGMTYDSIDNEILINIKAESLGGVKLDFPSGVWAYNRDIGLYHKFSPSLQLISETGADNIIDYGQSIVDSVGAIKALKLSRSATEKGRILFGATVYKDANTGNESKVVGLFTDDTQEENESFGYLTSTEVHSSDVLDVWNKIYIKYKNLLHSSDLIMVKYKTEMKNRKEITISWANDNTILTNNDCSGYEQGDEIQFIQGAYSGASANIVSISQMGGGYSIALDQSFPVISETSKCFIDNFKIAGKVTPTDNMQYKELPIPKDKNSPVIQIKVVMKFTGKNEVYGLKLDNSNLIK